ncbi:CvpA family protein [Staphylococcus marylandisciuri]|nr:CvpA family protein [Staphylococcus marylandisciuri]
MRGSSSGLWSSLVNLLINSGAVFIAYYFYMPLASKLDSLIPFPKTKAYSMNYTYHFDNLEQRFDDVIAFIIIALVARLLLQFVIGVLSNAFHSQRPHLISRLLGIAPSLIVALFIISLGLYTVSLYPNETIQHQLATSFLSNALLNEIPYISNFVQHI